MFKTDSRILSEASYIIDNNATVRQTAKAFGLSKSTIYKDVAYTLSAHHPLIYKKVRIVLDKNKAEGPMRGGLATQKKWRQLRK